MVVGADDWRYYLVLGGMLDIIGNKLEAYLVGCHSNKQNHRRK